MAQSLIDKEHMWEACNVEGGVCITGSRPMFPLTTFIH